MNSVPGSKNWQAYLIIGLFLLLLFMLIYLQACVSVQPVATKKPDTTDLSSLEYLPEAYRYYAPRTENPQYVLDYHGFVLEFDSMSRSAKWVCYALCRNNLGDGVERSGNFRMERRLGALSPKDMDYRNSGYDRGHLAPAADMSYSEEAMYDSFFLTNASPQLPGFNRGIWKRLEEKVREIAMEKDSIWVITGPVLQNTLPKLVGSDLRIPEVYFKVIYKPSSTDPQGIGFLLRNESSSADLTEFIVSIDSVESLTSIDFFPWLAPMMEAKVENKYSLPYWFPEAELKE
jgi:endonuclease G